MNGPAPVSCEVFHDPGSPPCGMSRMCVFYGCYSGPAFKALLHALMVCWPHLVPVQQDCIQFNGDLCLFGLDITSLILPQPQQTWGAL